MRKLVLSLLAVAAASVFTARGAQAAIPKKAHHKVVSAIPKNLELWCGATNLREKADFPYLAAIRTYKKHGSQVHVATIYKGKRVVGRQMVMKQGSFNGANSYLSSGSDDFSLNLSNHSSISRAQFKAVIRDEDGTKLISDGNFQCVVTKRS